MIEIVKQENLENYYVLLEKAVERKREERRNWAEATAKEIVEIIMKREGFEEPDEDMWHEWEELGDAMINLVKCGDSEEHEAEIPWCNGTRTVTVIEKDAIGRRSREATYAEYREAAYRVLKAIDEHEAATQVVEEYNEAIEIMTEKVKKAVEMVEWVKSPLTEAEKKAKAELVEAIRKRWRAEEEEEEMQLDVGHAVSESCDVNHNEMMQERIGRIITEAFDEA